MQSNIERKYNKLCHTRSDINEHLPTLFKYASGCESIFETGVRGCVSSWALISGLLNNNKPVLKEKSKKDIELYFMALREQVKV